MNKRRLALSIGLSIASIGAGYGIWGLILVRRGGDDANIGSGVALLVGGTLLIVGSVSRRCPC